MLYRRKNGQAASLDFVLSGIVIILIVAVVVGFFILYNEEQDVIYSYDNWIFENIDRGDVEGVEGDSRDFLDGNIINMGKLIQYDNDNELQYVSNIERMVFWGSDVFNPYNNDVCMFFMNNGAIVDFDSTATVAHSVGFTRDDIADDEADYTGCVNLSSGKNHPCEYYDKSYVFVKPVLMNRSIVNMYVVVCEK